MKIINLIFVFFIVFSFQCAVGIKRVSHYHKHKREIATIRFIKKVNMVQIKDDNSKSSSKWEISPSEKADSLISAIINMKIAQYSRRRLPIIPDSFIIDSTTFIMLKKLSGKLELSKHFDSVLICDQIIRCLAPIESRYVLVICEEGYHFSQKYLDRIEGIEAAQFLASTAFMGLAAGIGGIGILRFGPHDKGYSDIFAMLLDKQEKRVLYYAQRISHDNPLEDSTIINQLSSMFFNF